MPIFDVNQPSQKAPLKWIQDPELNFFVNENMMWRWQVWNRVLSDNVKDGSGAISPIVDLVYVDGGGTSIMPEIDGAKMRVTIKNTGTTNQILTTPDNALIEGCVDALLYPDHSYTLSPDGTNWWIV